MELFNYTWREGNGPIHKITGDAQSIYEVAKRLELPVRPFWSKITEVENHLEENYL